MLLLCIWDSVISIGGFINNILKLAVIISRTLLYMHGEHLDISFRTFIMRN